MSKDISFFLRKEFEDFVFTDGLEVKDVGDYLVYRFLNRSRVRKLFYYSCDIEDELIRVMIKSNVFEPEAETHLKLGLVIDFNVKDNNIDMNLLDEEGCVRLYSLSRNVLATNPYNFIEDIVEKLGLLHNTSKLVLVDNVVFTDHEKLMTFKMGRYTDSGLMRNSIGDLASMHLS